MEAAAEVFVACHYLRKLSVKRHGGLITHLQNQFTLGTDMYPKALTVAYNMYIKWKNGTEERQPYQKRFVPQEGVSLATNVDDGERDYSGVKCFFCNEMGHIATHCPKKKGRSEGKGDCCRDCNYHHR